MPNNKIVKLGDLHLSLLLGSSQLVELPKTERALPLDIYLLPYSLEEFYDPNQIPDRDLKQAQKLKINHIGESYLNAVQLLFSALVMTHLSIPYFKNRIHPETIQAAQSANLIPKHCETLDQVFGGDKPTKIRKYRSRCSYSDLSDIFDLGKSFFRSEPPFSRNRENDIIFSGWSYGFDGDGETSINIKFDPWFKTMNCIIINALWDYFKSRFPEEKSKFHKLTDPALEARMATYLGINTSDHDDFIRTTLNLLSQKFDLYRLQQLGSQNGILGIRKEKYPQDPPGHYLPKLIKG